MSAIEKRHYLVGKLINETRALSQFFDEVKNNFPETIIERKMKKMGVELIIVHKDEYGLDKIIEIQNWGKNKLIWEDSKTLVYKI